MSNSMSKKSSLLLWLNRPFPLLETPGEKVLHALFIASMVFLIMFFLRPFSLNNTYETPVIPIALYALLSFFVVFSMDVLLPLIFKKFYELDRWSIGHHLFNSLFKISFTAFCNGFLYKAMNESAVQMRTPLDIALFTFAVALLPSVMMSFFTEKRLFKKMNENALRLTAGITPKVRTDCPVVELDIDQARVALRCDKVLYASAEGNYVQLFVREEKNGSEELAVFTIRTPLKELLARFNCCGAIVQCHRSYIVNLCLVERVKGNARGYTLKLPLVSEGVAVSRSKAKMVLDTLAELLPKEECA